MSNILTSKTVGVNFNDPTFIMVGGLGIDDVKIKYNWFLNAEVKDAIIGEDENGLVWYSGIWVNGVWENGTWYSGTWYNGRWKDGNFYSYDITIDLIKFGNININGKDISKSKFLGGVWEKGNFHYGIFGRTRTIKDIPKSIDLDFIVNYSADFTLVNDNYIDEYDQYLDTGLTLSFYFSSPQFMSGDFYDGWMNASKFRNGNFHDGYLSNSLWYNGNFYNGIFIGDIWYNGSFYGGDFSNGTWKNGKLSSYKRDILTRFGTNYNSMNTNGIIYSLNGISRTYNKIQGCTWENGEFMSGEMHSTLVLIDGVPQSATNQDHTHWINGIFHNGEWYGGTFENGEWITGTMYNGLIYNIIWRNGFIKNCVWNNGIFYNGTIEGGLYKNIIIENGNIGYEI